MAAQLNYNYSTPKGVPGGKFDLACDEVVTRKNEEVTGKLKFGMAVAVGTVAGATVKVPTAETTAIEGVVVHHMNTEHDLEGKVVIKEGASVGVMKVGNIWGRLATDVEPTYGQKAYVVKAGDDAGCFTNVADGALEINATFGKYTDDGIAVIVLK